MEREALLAYIEAKTKEIDDLSARYAGVRPAWVGEEIGILTMYRNNAIKKLENSSDHNRTHSDQPPRHRDSLRRAG